ncbi:MAG: DUF2807 domain-containing protein [Mediterranea sp.]|jgi:hypothetical protein|nr:DUF2807 domain-containing protein [Mediterranea sp.]
MKKLITLMVCACLASGASISAQNNESSFWGSKKIVASNNYVTKSIRVDNFNAINAAGSFNVTFIQRDGRPEVIVNTSDNIVDLLNIAVKNGTLTVNFKKNVNVSYKKLDVTVYAKDVNRFSLAGSGDFNIKDGLKTNSDVSLSLAGSGDFNAGSLKCGNLNVSLAGSGDMGVVNVACGNLMVRIAGSGDINVKGITADNTEVSVAGSGDIVLIGVTSTAQYSIAGSGDISAKALEAKRVSASTTGSGDITCFASEYLKVRASGSGTVGYKGNPQIDYPGKKLYKL